MEGACNCCLIVAYVTYDKVELPLYLSTVSVKLNGEKAAVNKSSELFFLLLHYRPICLKWGKCELRDSASRTK